MDHGPWTTMKYEHTITNSLLKISLALSPTFMQNMSLIEQESGAKTYSTPSTDLLP